MNKEKLKGLQSFLKDDIWRVTEDEVSKSRGILYNAIKIATLSVREFTQGRILNKASALTYSTLLSIIPILAILFAIARGFGFSNLLETQFTHLQDYGMVRLEFSYASAIATVMFVLMVVCNQIIQAMLKRVGD